MGERFPELGDELLEAWTAAVMPRCSHEGAAESLLNLFPGSVPKWGFCWSYLGLINAAPPENRSPAAHQELGWWP